MSPAMNLPSSRRTARPAAVSPPPIEHETLDDRISARPKASIGEPRLLHREGILQDNLANHGRPP